MVWLPIIFWYNWGLYSLVLIFTGNTFLGCNFYLTRHDNQNKISYQNNYSVSPCTLWCNIWLININDICKKPDICVYGDTYPNCNSCNWWSGGTPKNIYHRDKQDIYLYPSEIR